MKKVMEQKFAQRALTVCAQADRIVIRSNEDCEKVAEALKKVKAWQQEWMGMTEPVEQKLRDGLAAFRALRRKVADPLAYAERVLKDRIGAWVNRLKAQEERAQVKAEARAETQAGRERQKTVEELREAGRRGEARALERQPLIVPPVVAPADRPQMSGVAIRQEWKFKIVKEGLIPREFLIPDRVKLGEMARTLKSECRIPGIEVYPETNVAAGAAEVA